MRNFTSIMILFLLTWPSLYSQGLKSREDLPVIPKSQVMEWVNAAKQHEKNPEVNWSKCTQFSARSNSDYLMSKGYGNDESISILSFVKNNMGGAYPSIVYNGLSFDITNECSKIGIKELSSKAHVEYGGYKMRPEDKEMGHFFYIWDVGAKGFIVKSFPGKNTPDSKIGTAVILLGDLTVDKIKDDFKVMVVDWLGKEKYGFVLYPGTGAKSLSTFFCEDSKSNSECYGLGPLSNIGISTLTSQPELGYLDKSAGLFLSSVIFKYGESYVAAFPLTKNPKEPDKLPNTGMARIVDSR